MSHAPTFSAAREVVAAGVASRAFPAASVDVGRAAGSLWRESFGRLSYDSHSPACTPDTIFDLASLTKVIATASVAMRLVAADRLMLDLPVAALVPEWRVDQRSCIEVKHLLDHSSGLPAHQRLWERAAGRAAFLRELAALALERSPGAQSVYSDPGFMLLGLLLERIGNETLDRQLRPIALAVDEPLLFRPQPSLYERTAPTEYDPWRGRVLCGEVHDENAAAIGGVAGHAGMFGTAGAVAAFARLVLRTFNETTVLGTPSLMRTFATRTSVPGSSRALAWDTALPTSSCGPHMSAAAIGHTGFTGTSLWIDPERDLYFVLLTNRVHPTRANEQLLAIRPAFHSAVLGELGSDR